MRQKFGSVALYAIEIGAPANIDSYTESQELVEFQRKHDVSNKMMGIAFDYAKLYLKGLIDTPRDFIDKVSMDEANSLIVKLQGETKMSVADNSKVRDYNNKDLSVNLKGDTFVISGEMIKDSKEARATLKKNGAVYSGETNTWAMKDIYADNKNLKDPLQKESMLYGTLITICKNEANFNKAKENYYKAKERGADNKAIEGARYIYNIANLVLHENFSASGKKEFFDKMMVKTAEELEKMRITLADLEQGGGENKNKIEFLKKDIEKAVKYLDGKDDRDKHLEYLIADVKILEDMGYLKQGNNAQKDTLFMASIDHRRVLTSVVEEQNKRQSEGKEVSASFVDEYLGKKAEQVKANLEQKAQNKQGNDAPAKEQNEEQNEERSSRNRYGNR